MELHFYDFDGTLFRSPPPPNGERDRVWWAQSESLSPPCVPLKPSGDWWIAPTVASAKMSISDMNTWAVLCTGRHHNSSMRYRIPELLRDKGLHFDDVYLKNESSTKVFKARVLLKLLKEFPKVQTVQIWEDRSTNLQFLCSAVERTGRLAIPHMVKQPSRLCVASGSVIFTEVILDNPKALMRWWLSKMGSPLLKNRLAHHMTLSFKPSVSSVLSLPLGETVSLKIKGYAQDEHAQVVVVEPPAFLRNTGRVPHVTIATDGTPPVYSNTLLRNRWEPTTGPSITGKVGFFTGREHTWDYEGLGISSKTTR